jgi:uncharacterized damage-inducible protein DinB
MSIMSDSVTVSPFAPLYDGWEAYQESLIGALAALTPEQLDYGSAPHLRSVGENCRHMLGARGRWCIYILDIRDDPLPDLARWDAKDAAARTSAELAEGLHVSWRLLRDAMQGWSAEDLAVTIPNVDREPGEPEVFTRQWVIWHLIEHDLHHGGEISQILGAHGLAGINI